MLIKVLRSKIHRARVTATHLEYEGSITIDEDLLDAAGLVEGAAVLVANLSNGSRQETYVMKGERGSGIVQHERRLGPPGRPRRHRHHPGLCVLTPEELAGHKPRKVDVNEKNQIVRGP